MPIFETERLILRPFRHDDWPVLQAYVSRPETTRYDHDYPTSDEACQGICDYFAGQDGIWAVVIKETGQLIGHVVCSQIEPPELRTWSLGFVLDSDHWSRGYATEACRRVLDYIFRVLGARRVEAGCHPDNPRSWRLLERLGLRREAHYIKKGYLKRTPEGEPIFWDGFEYGLLAEEWV